MNSNAAKRPQPNKKARIVSIDETLARKAKRQEYRAYRKKIKVFMAFSLTLAFLFGGNIYLRTEIGNTKQAIDKANSELKILKSEKDILFVKMEKAVSYSTLEKAAKKLGMQKKQPSQIHYIKTPDRNAVEIIEP